MFKIMRKILFLSFLALMGYASISFVFSRIVHAAEQECGTYAPFATTLYAPPYDLLSGTSLLHIVCDGADKKIEVGSNDSNTIVYEHGWQYISGAWQPITFSGESRLGGDQSLPWFVGKATAPLSQVQSGANYVVAFTCSSTTGSWRCGCVDGACTKHLWQLQIFTFDTGGTDGGTGGDCSGGSGPIRGKDRVLPSGCVGEPYTYIITDCEGFGLGLGDDGTIAGTVFKNTPGLKMTGPTGRRRTLQGTPTEAGTFKLNIVGRQGTSSCGGQPTMTVSP